MSRSRHCLSSLIVVSSVHVVQLLGGSWVSKTSSLRPATAYVGLSRPHRCVLQRLMNNRVWAAVLATTTLLRIVVQVLTKGRPNQVRSTSSFCLNLHDRRAIHYTQERLLLRYRPLAASANFAFLVVPPRAVAIRSRVREIFGS